MAKGMGQAMRNEPDAAGNSLQRLTLWSSWLRFAEEDLAALGSFRRNLLARSWLCSAGGLNVDAASGRVPQPGTTFHPGGWQTLALFGRKVGVPRFGACFAESLREGGSAEDRATTFRGRHGPTRGPAFAGATAGKLAGPWHRSLGCRGWVCSAGGRSASRRCRDGWRPLGFLT